MSDLEKGRVQRDAQRRVSSRRSLGSTNPERAILSHLGVELYKEHRRAEHLPETSSPPDDEPTDESADRS